MLHREHFRLGHYSSCRYASAIVVHVGGRKQYVQFLSKGIVGVDARTGEFLWRYKEVVKGPAQAFTPVARDGYIYGGALGIGGGLVRLKPDGNGIAAEQVYFERGLPNGFGGAVLVGDYLYGTNTAMDPLVAVEFTTGKVKWKAENFGMSSLAYADGHLYLHNQNEISCWWRRPLKAIGKRADSLLRIRRRKNDRGRRCQRGRMRFRSLRTGGFTFAISEHCRPTTLRQGIEPQINAGNTDHNSKALLYQAGQDGLF